MQITTIGYINLETRQFYTTREEWMASKTRASMSKAKVKAQKFLRSLILVSALDYAKAKLRLGYTWERFINYTKAKLNVLRNKAQQIFR